AESGHGRVSVRFSELPIDQWHDLPSSQKRDMGVTGSPTVSVVRAGREIDRGWFFMGAKRRENYDDWWRCEVSFEPVLDELFGVTHTKQKINPTVELNEVLVPDLERVARELNGIVRKRYTDVRTAEFSGRAITAAEQRDVRMEPLPLRRSAHASHAPGRAL